MFPVFNSGSAGSVSVCFTVSGFFSFLYRVAGATNYFYLENIEGSNLRSSLRISKSAAVLIGFYIFHAIPNILLASRSGRTKYSRYGHYHSRSNMTKVIETFLLGAVITHGFLSSKRAISRWFPGTASLQKNRSTEMFLTGSVIMFLLLFHLGHFRFIEKGNQDLDRAVMETLDRKHSRLRNGLYWIFVVTVGAHALRGNTRPWLCRLGFKGREVPVLHRVGQFLIVASSVLYSIPLVMENPYGQLSRSVKGPRIISVD